MVIERAERRIRPSSLPDLALIQGGRSERTASLTPLTFEQEALTNAGISSLQEIPEKDFAVVAAVLAMDAIDFSEKLKITYKEKRHILAHHLFTVAKDTYIRDYMNEGSDKKTVEAVSGQFHQSVEQKIWDLLNPLWESDRLIEAYNEFRSFVKLVDGVMPSFRYDADKRRVVANEVAMLKRQGFTNQEIPGLFSALKKVLHRQKWGRRRAPILGAVINFRRNGLTDQEIAEQKTRVLAETKIEQSPEEKFLSVHPEAYEVLLLKQSGLNNVEIGKELRITIRKVERLVFGLLYFGKIPPRASQLESTEKRNNFLAQLIDLRVNAKLGNIEIAQKLGVAYDKICNWTSFLIWMGILDPVERSEVLLRRSGRRLAETKLIDFLEGFPSGNSIILTETHQKFIQTYPEVSMDYQVFLNVFGEISKRHPVPHTRVTYPIEVRERMIAEIQKIRAEKGNVRLNVGRLCLELGVNPNTGKEAFSSFSVEETGPANTPKWRSEGKLRFIEALKEIAVKKETVNIWQLCKQIGIGYKLGLQVYRNAEGQMELPPLKPHKQRKFQTVIFEASPI